MEKLTAKNKKAQLAMRNKVLGVLISSTKRIVLLMQNIVFTCKLKS